jgi:peroxiredoxin
MSNSYGTIGLKAPDFTLMSHLGNPVSLKDQLSKGPVMLAFYPGDFTPVCTKQLCSYKDHEDDFKRFNLQILGISANPPESHAKFAQHYGFRFPLLTDEKRAVSKAFGCTSLLMLGGVSRAVFILDSQGTILYRYVEPTILTRRKPGELLRILENLRSNKLL